MSRFIVPLDQLPVPDVQGNHRIRFRVTTEDQNSVSEWSTVFKVQSLGQINPTQVEARVVALKEGGPYEVSWKEEISIQLPSGNFIKRKISEYDVFIQWNYQENFEFYGRFVNNNIVVFPEEGQSPTSLRMTGQLATYPFPPKNLGSIQVFDTGVVEI